jgi:nucleoside-diphosphate-sugar epimerase
VAAYKKTEHFPLIENDSPLGEWPLWGEYNTGKVGCENFLNKSRKSYASVRPAYMLGPKNHRLSEMFIYSKLSAGLPIILPGKGDAKIQFTFVEEVGELVSKIADQKASGLYNCAGDDIVTLRELVEKMAKIVGTKEKLLCNAAADGTNHDSKEFPFANESIICSNQRARTLGVTFRTLDQGLKRDYEDYYQARVSS